MKFLYSDLGKTTSVCIEGKTEDDIVFQYSINLDGLCTIHNVFLHKSLRKQGIITLIMLDILRNNPKVFAFKLNPIKTSIKYWKKRGFHKDESIGYMICYYKNFIKINS